MLESSLRDLRAQWQESPLLRLGSWGIGLIILLYLVLWLDDALALRQLDWRRQAQATAEMQALQQQRYWPALVRELQAQHQQLLDDSWQANTSGLAKAAVREFINQSAAASTVGIRLRQTEFAEPQPLTEGIFEMRGRLNATTEGSSVPWDWLAALERHSPRFIVDSLEVRVGQRAGVALTVEFRMPISGLEAAPQ